MDNQHKIKWTLYISFASMFIFISVIEIGPFAAFKRTLRMYSDHDLLCKYVIVFDGGSTGTRIHIFNFENNTASGHLTLKDEYFEEVKPGLSNYAYKPYKAAKSVVNLLQKAKAHIPSNLWDETPVVLKATAGLRLLPTSVSDSILDAVNEAFQNSPFLSDDNSVAVLDGQDEGLYAWHTLNFLLGRLNKPAESVVSLDLGGGSTQVTFTPVELNTFINSPKEYMIVSKGLNKSIPIYTHSYLGFGLMAARVGILNLSANKAELARNDNHFSSWCIHPLASFTWKYDQKEYKVTGREDEKFNFQDCYRTAAEFLSDAVDKPNELLRREIYALSYYFDRAKDMGAIERRGGVISVGGFMNACRKQCSKKDDVRPLLCLDCSYISAIYHHALGLSEQKEIHLVTEINGIETSWGLGAAFDMLS